MILLTWKIWNATWVFKTPIMKKNKWLYYLDIALLTLSTYLLINKVNIYIETGIVDILRTSINIIFLVYIFYKIVQYKKSE